MGPNRVVTPGPNQTVKLKLSQWEFYVPPTWRLDERERSQHSIPLPSLRAMTSALPWAGLDGAVRVAADSQRQSQSARTPDEAPRV